MKKLYSSLPQGTTIEFYKIPFENFNHVDFLWGIDANELVYKKMIEVMTKYR